MRPRTAVKITKSDSECRPNLLIQRGLVNGKKHQAKSSIDVSAPIELSQETTLAKLMKHDRFSLLAYWIRHQGVPPEQVVQYGGSQYVVAISPVPGQIYRAVGYTIYPPK